MSTHRNIDKICVAFMVLALVITVLFMNGEKLGITVIHDEDSESYEEKYEGSEYFTANDVNDSWDTSEATVITLSDDGIDVDGTGAYADGNSLVIAMSGEYVISGELSDGSIVVDANDNSKVFIMLDGALVNCSDNAAFRVGQADKVFLTLAEGSVNTFSSGETYSAVAEADGADGVIYAHDDLTINGSGELNITGSYKHGIEANDSLKITGGKITISAPKDGITVNDKFAMKDADITIDVSDDGIHADEEIYVESGTLLVNSCYEGLESAQINIAGGDITLYPSDDGLNATDGTSSGFGMMGMGSFGPSGSEDADTGDEPDGDGGEDSGNSEDSSDSEDSGLPRVHITGGSLTIINEDAKDADGIDSNGDIIIDGGNIFVNLDGNGTNNALDYGSESGGICEINGGNVIACGGYAMAEGADATSDQVSIMYTISSGVKAGETVYLEDEDENVIMQCTLQCDATCIIMSCPDISLGETYLMVIGDTVDEIRVSEVSATYGDSQSSMFGGTMNFGHSMGMDIFRQNRGNRGKDTQSSDSESETAPQTDEAGEMPQNPGGDGMHGGRHGGPKGEMTPPDADSSETGTDQAGQESGMMTPPDMDGQPGEMAPPDADSSETGTDQAGQESGMMTPPDMDGQPGDMTPPDMDQGGPGMGMDQGGPGMGMDQGGPGAENTAEEETETGHSITDYGVNAWLIYGGCLVLLLIGIAAAAGFRRRRFLK